MRLCINPYCSSHEGENADTAIHCEYCGCDLLIAGTYAVKSLLSNKSGFGTVYTVEDDAQQLKVLKVLKPRFNSEQRTVALFQQEAYLLQQIDAPALPKIDAYIHHELPDGRQLHGIVMEKIAGSNLQDWLKARGNQPISQGRAIAWLREIVQALQVVHQKNYFHRDIKPSNIMLKPSGELVLIDFGSARHESYTYMDKLYGEGGITQITSIGYTAPEQERGFALPQSDFFALGMTFMHLVTGKYPLDIYDANTDIYHWREHAPHITPAFAHLLDNLISAQPIERPPDCASILHSLDELDPAQPLPTKASTKPQSWLTRAWLGLTLAGVMGCAIAVYYRLLPSPQPMPASSQALDCPSRNAASNTCALKQPNKIYATTPY